MSTSNPIDTALLEQLANQYFQAQPGQQPVASQNDILLQHGETVNMAEPQTSLHDPHFPEVGGLFLLLWQGVENRLLHSSWAKIRK